MGKHTRGQENQSTEFQNTNFLKNSFMFRATQDWNSLPTDKRTVQSTATASKNTCKPTFLGLDLANLAFTYDVYIGICMNLFMYNSFVCMLYMLYQAGLPEKLACWLKGHFLKQVELSCAEMYFLRLQCCCFLHKERHQLQPNCSEKCYFSI